MKNQLWVEKYRPKSVSEYVFTDERLKEQVEGWINEQMIPQDRKSTRLNSSHT